MDEHCDMCEFYDLEGGFCSRYHESHYPSDGEGCPGFMWYTVRTDKEEE